MPSSNLSRAVSNAARDSDHAWITHSSLSTMQRTPDRISTFLTAQQLGSEHGAQRWCVLATRGPSSSLARASVAASSL